MRSRTTTRAPEEGKKSYAQENTRPIPCHFAAAPDIEAGNHLFLIYSG
jgi:hypothetical protein